jgi:hypothetical protein
MATHPDLPEGVTQHEFDQIADGLRKRQLDVYSRLRAYKRSTDSWNIHPAHHFEHIVEFLRREERAIWAMRVILHGSEPAVVSWGDRYGVRIALGRGVLWPDKKPVLRK